jgi:chromosome segregation ATPase
LASREDIVEDVEAVGALFARCSNANPEVAVLLQELERLGALLKEKSSALASLEGATSSSSSSSARLALCYKNERNVLHTQYQALLLHNQASLEHCSKVEALLTQTQTELAEKRALSRRLESDLRAKEEELQSARMECEYFKAKSSSAQAKHKQELLLLQLHVSKAKESEEALRREKETDMDRYTELMVDAQRRNEADRKLAEEKIDSLTLKVEQQGEQMQRIKGDPAKVKVNLDKSDRLFLGMTSYLGWRAWGQVIA